jgi:hypothetical protein
MNEKRVSIIRQLLEDAHTWPADEREFYIQRVEAKERHSRERCWGISSDALAHYALGMTGAPPKGLYPHDRGDLAACERTYEMAPPRLQRIMEPVLVGYRAYVAERYPA